MDWKAWLRKYWICIPLLALAGGQLHLQSRLDHIGQDKPLVTLRTAKLEIVNDDGRAVVIASANKAGDGTIAITDPAGNVRLGLVGTAASGRVNIFTGPNDNLMKVVRLGVNDDGGGLVETVTADDQGFVQISATNLHPSIMVLNTASESGIMLGYPGDSNREPLIELFGAGMESRARIETRKDQGRVWVWGAGGLKKRTPACVPAVKDQGPVGGDFWPALQRPSRGSSGGANSTAETTGENTQSPNSRRCEPFSGVQQ